MKEKPLKPIPFAKLFEIAADHIFGDPSLVEFIPDEKSAVDSPENMRKKSQEAAIQLSLLHSKHTEIMKTPASAIDAEARRYLEKQRDELQEKIQTAFNKWTPEPLLRDYEARFEKRNHAVFVLEKLLHAHIDGKIALRLNSEVVLPHGIFSPAYRPRFLPRDSVLECVIDGETCAGIVAGDETETREWLASEDVIAGKFDTPEKRKRKCAELLEARLHDPSTRNCSKKAHLTAIRMVVPGLLKEEFGSVRRALGSKFPHIRKPGRRPNLPAEA